MRTKHNRKRNIMDAIIMCAGLGTRLRPITNDTPKPLVPIAGKGSLERTLEMLPDEITRIIIVVGYLADQIKTKIGSEYRGRPVVYVTQEVLDGTGGCLRQVKAQITNLSERFFVVNGDDLYAADDFKRLVQAPIGLLTLQSIAPRTIDSCTVDGEGCLTGFTETAKGQIGRINTGAYCLDHRWFQTKPVLVPGKTTEWSLPHAVLELAKQGIPVMVLEASFWMPVGTHEELKAAEAYLTA
jgi:NDP-sugar pyrophosphorylase family protein